MDISIICITYNHVNYINTCIESLLMQKTKYSFEIIIHDDASNDGTTEIIKFYQTKEGQEYYQKWMEEKQK